LWFAPGFDAKVLQRGIRRACARLAPGSPFDASFHRVARLPAPPRQYTHVVEDSAQAGNDVALDWKVCIRGYRAAFTVERALRGSLSIASTHDASAATDAVGCRSVLCGVAHPATHRSSMQSFGKLVAGREEFSGVVVVGQSFGKNFPARDIFSGVTVLLRLVTQLPLLGVSTMRSRHARR
jgi:hypothetical protein